MDGERVDAPLPLRQQLEKLEARRTRERLSDSSELPVQPILERAMGCVLAHIQIIY